VYGLEYFTLALAVVLASHARVIDLRRWASLLFDPSTPALPVCAVLAWISKTQIHSFCLMCMLVYAVNVALVILLGIPNRKRLAEFATEGPRELARYVSESPRHIIVAIAALLALSQVMWMPEIVESDAGVSSDSKASEVQANDGSWRGEPVSRQTLGQVNAPVQIEEFTDFQCPFCGRAHHVLLELVQRYPGKIHLVHRDYPLDKSCNPTISEAFHPDACNAAYFALCASEQNLYWPFEETLFANQRKLNDAFMLSAGESLGLDPSKLRTCVQAPSTRAAVLEDIREGIKRKIEGTPTVFLNGEPIVGAKPIDFWTAKIDAILGAARSDMAPPVSAAASTP